MTWQRRVFPAIQTCLIDTKLSLQDMTDINQTVARNVERYRLQRKISASQVAKLAGISKATLLSIELGRANPTLDTLQRLGGALNVRVTELIAESSEAVVDVRRAGEGRKRQLDGMQLRPLATFYGSELVYVFTATVNARGVISPAHESGSAESVLVLSGAVMAGPCDALVELNTGDWIRFPTDRPHACQAVGETAEVLFVAVRRRIPGVVDERQSNPVCGMHAPNPG